MQERVKKCAFDHFWQSMWTSGTRYLHNNQCNNAAFGAAASSPWGPEFDSYPGAVLWSLQVLPETAQICRRFCGFLPHPKNMM